MQAAQIPRGSRAPTVKGWAALSGASCSGAAPWAACSRGEGQQCQAGAPGQGVTGWHWTGFEVPSTQTSLGFSHLTNSPICIQFPFILSDIL